MMASTELKTAGYTVAAPAVRLPRLRLRDISVNLSAAEIAECVFHQNPEVWTGIP